MLRLKKPGRDSSPVSQQQPQQTGRGTREPPGARTHPKVHQSNPSGLAGRRAGDLPVPFSLKKNLKRPSECGNNQKCDRVIIVLANLFLLLRVPRRETLPDTMIKMEELRLLLAQIAQTNWKHKTSLSQIA